jgi:protein FRA10AC1
MDHSSRKRPAPAPQDYHSRRIFRNNLNGQSAWDRHKTYVSRYLKVYERDGGKARQAQLDAKTRNDWDVLKERHRFLRDEDGADDAESGSSSKVEYENEVAKRYYNHLFKEFAIVDMKHYKSGNLALRWRSEEDVIDGIGQFSESLHRSKDTLVVFCLPCNLDPFQIHHSLRQYSL